MNELLTLVIPCYNEENNIPSVLPDVIAFCEKNNACVIVVNDGSSDRSLELLNGFHSPKLRVISHKRNRGYGGALKTGILSAETQYVITLDADGQHRLEDVSALFDLIREKNADMVVGTRTENASGLYRTLGKNIIRSLTRFLLGCHFRDMNSGMKIYDRKEVLPLLPLCPDGMAFSDICLLLMYEERKLILEQDIQIKPRIGGTSTINTRTAIDTLFEIFNILMLFHPMKLFFSLAVLSFLIGFGWGIRTWLCTSNVTATSTMFISNSVILLLIGLVAEQLAKLRREIFHSNKN